MKTPLVSVGMPVFNGEGTVRRALESILAQSHVNLEIIINDDASTDGTDEICRSVAAMDSRMHYSRNLTNTGVFANTRRVLALASGDYFMWAAQDDLWLPTFVERNLATVLQAPSLMASVSRVRFTHHGRILTGLQRPQDTRPLLGSPTENAVSYLTDMGYNSRLYALHPRSVLAKCAGDETTWAADSLIVLRTLAFEGYAEVDDELMFRELRGTSSAIVKQVRSWNPPGIAQFLPLWPFTRSAWKLAHVPKSPNTVRVLLIQNILYAYILFRERLRSRLPRLALLLPYRSLKGLTWRPPEKDDGSPRC